MLEYLATTQLKESCALISHQDNFQQRTPLLLAAALRGTESENVKVLLSFDRKHCHGAAEFKQDIYKMTLVCLTEVVIVCANLL